MRSAKAGTSTEAPTRMSDQPPQQVEPGQLVQEDLPWLVCGYSLQGLASDSNCPECGTPVDRSLRGPLLRYSSPEYLHTLHRGIVYAEVGTALRLGCSVGFFVIQYGVVGYGPMGLGQQMMIEVAQGLITAIMLVGWWMFTTPDPGAGGSEPGVQARRWTRAMVVVMGGLEVLLAAFSFLPVVRTGHGGRGRVRGPARVHGRTVVAGVGRERRRSDRAGLLSAGAGGSRAGSDASATGDAVPMANTAALGAWDCALVFLLRRAAAAACGGDRAVFRHD